MFTLASITMYIEIPSRGYNNVNITLMYIELSILKVYMLSTYKQLSKKKIEY